MVVSDATGGQHLPQKLEISRKRFVVALDGGEVVKAVFVAAVGVEGPGEALVAGEQELGHDTVDKNVTGNKAAVLVMLEWEVNFERVVPGIWQLPVVG